MASEQKRLTYDTNFFSETYPTLLFIFLLVTKQMNFGLQVYTVHAWIHVHRQLLEKRNHFGKTRFRHKQEGTPSDVHQLPDYQTY